MQLHSIRLHGPWQATVLQRFESDCKASDRNESNRNESNRDESDRNESDRNESDLGISHEPITFRAQVPSDWSESLGASFHGRVRYQRSFHTPSGLEPAQAVWLVVEAVDFSATIELNGTPLGQLQCGQPSFRQPVESLLARQLGSQLADRNRLTIEIDAPREGAGGLIGSVRLEIENES